MGLILELSPAQAARFRSIKLNLRKTGRFPMDPNKILEIKETLAENPNTSVYRHAINLGISEQTIRKVRAGGFD